MRTLCVTVALLGLLPMTASAGPWTPEPGGGYLKVQARWLPGVGFFAAPGEPPEMYGAYNEVFLGGFYAELGLAPRLGLSVASDGFRLFFLADPRDKSVGAHLSFGEPTLTLKVQAVQAGPFALALSGFVRPPGAPNDVVQDVVSVAEGNPIVGGLRIGTGVFEGGATLELGAGFSRFYLAGAGGMRARGGGWDSVLQWSAEVGASLGKESRTGLRLRLAGFHPLKDGEAPYHASPSGIGNGTAYVGFTLELERKLNERLAVGVSIAGGLGPVVRQTGGPVITGYLATSWP